MASSAEKIEIFGPNVLESRNGGSWTRGAEFTQNLVNRSDFVKFDDEHVWESAQNEYNFFNPAALMLTKMLTFYFKPRIRPPV